MICPPECLYQIRQGKNYGWPYSYSLNHRPVPDPDLGSKGVRQTGFSLFEYQAHAAPPRDRLLHRKEFSPPVQPGFVDLFSRQLEPERSRGLQGCFSPLEPKRKAGKTRRFFVGIFAGRRAGRQAGGTIERPPRASFMFPTTTAGGFSRWFIREPTD